MESKTNYTIVGVIVLLLIGGLLSTALWLSVGFNQKKFNSYTVYLHEAASGLADGAAVKYNGVQVGFVKEIKLNKNDPRQVEIILSIEDGTPITTSTSATLISQGITGVTYVGLSAGSSDLTPLRRMEGEPFPVIPAKPSLLNQLDSILKEVSQGIGEVSDTAKKIFNDENALAIKHTLANVDKISSAIAKNDKNIDVFLVNLAKISKGFPKMINNMSKAGKSISKTMNVGENTLDKISQQTIPPIVDLLRHWNSISANFEKVSNQVRQNPSVVLRGTTTPKLGPGE